MTEREEFEEWCKKSYIIPMNFDPVDMMWSAWQAARASRWRSIESAPKDGSEIATSDRDCDVSSARYWSGKGLWIAKSGFKPIVWHPLPDPPTKEELENLK